MWFWLSRHNFRDTELRFCIFLKLSISQKTNEIGKSLSYRVKQSNSIITRVLKFTTIVKEKSLTSLPFNIINHNFYILISTLIEAKMFCDRELRVLK